MTAVDSLERERYVLLTTFRRDGTPVPTPVWVARDRDALVVWSVTDAGKVKRLRRTSAVTVAPCDARGRPLGGPVPGRAVLLDAAGTDRVRAALARKYGLFGRLTLLGSRIRRGRDGTIGIRISLPS